MDNFEREAKELKRAVMERYHRAMASHEGLIVVAAELGGLRIERSRKLWRSTDDFGEQPRALPPRGRHVLEAIAQVLIKTWEWHVTENINGDCTIYLTRKLTQHD